MIKIKSISVILSALLTQYLPAASADNLCQCSNEYERHPCTAYILRLSDSVEIYNESAQCTEVTWQSSNGKHTDVFYGGLKQITFPRAWKEKNIEITSCNICGNNPVNLSGVDLSELQGEWNFRDIAVKKDPNYQFEGTINFVLDHDRLVGTMVYNERAFATNEVDIKIGTSSHFSGTIHKSAVDCHINARKNRLHCLLKGSTRGIKNGIIVFER